MKNVADTGHIKVVGNNSNNINNNIIKINNDEMMINIDDNMAYY